MSSNGPGPAAVLVTPPSPSSSPESRNNPQLSNHYTAPTGVYAVQKEQQQGSGSSKMRRPTPGANASLSTHRTNGFGKSATYGLHMGIVTEPLKEEESSDNDTEPMRMSPAAQAAALSAFLSVNNSDSDESETHARITGVYREPLDLDGLEALVLGILRTGKLTIQGTPGDMTKIQPALFALQCNEREVPQLLPQILQSPLFNPNTENSSASSSSLKSSPADVLQNGRFRIGMFLDTAIYTLLKGHCAKNAKQAEAIITTLMATNYIPVDTFPRQMPPMIFQSAMARQSPPAIPGPSMNGVGRGKDPSSSSISSVSTTTSVSSIQSTSSTSTSSLEEGITEKARDDKTEESWDKFDHNKPPQGFKKKRTRKTSSVHSRPLRPRSSSTDMSDEDGGLLPNAWNSSVIDNNTLVCQYGHSDNPLLMWNPKLTMDFQVKSSIGLLCGTVTGVDPSNRIVTVRVVNNSSKNVAFSIRAFRQSTIFTSHVVYPTKGLQMLDKGEVWEDNVELFPMVKGTSEIFVIDLLVCTMEEQPSWNILRKYAAMRGVKSDSSKPQLAPGRRISRKRPSVFYMPGTKDQKEENMKIILSHGLQCVVKGKLEEAEIIFTQALLLPDFQRIELKAFVYICLAVVANKRQSKGHYDSLLPVLNEVSAASQLVDAVEASPGTVRMPRMMQLVKQLKKELDVHKIFTDYRQKTDGKKLPRVDDVQWKESEHMTQEGGTLSCKSTTVHIPQNAVKEPTQITLSTPDISQLESMLKNTGWDNTVGIVAVVHLDCSPLTAHFSAPLEITTVLPQQLKSTPQYLRLVHSNYLRHWQDVTDEQYSSVSIQENKRVTIKTDRSGWIAVTNIVFDPSLIVLKAMRSLSIDPIMLHFSVYGLAIPDTRIFQIATFMSPGTTTEEKPQHHIPIAFPYAAQAYPGERLKLTFEGQFEAEASMNEKDLSYEFNVRSHHTIVCEKWLRLLTTAGTPLSGRIVLSACRNTTDDWESIAEIRLSSKTGFASKDSSIETKSASSGSDSM